MIIIDGNRFVTTEGAQSFYLERRTTHIGDWDIWLIKQDEYSIHLAVPPDEMEKNLYRLIKNSETFPKEEEEAYENMLHQSNYISQRMHEIDEEERFDAIEDREEAEMVAYYCALYDMENGMSEGKSLDKLQDEYMSMPEEELLFQYQTKYEEKPLLHETQERLRTRTHGGRVRVKEE